MYTYLSVAAHPDDEILGFGGTSYYLTQKGHKVVNCILSGKVDARLNRPDLIELKKNIIDAQKIVGAEPPVLADFPNIKFNTVPHLDLVQFIEKTIEDVCEEIGADKLIYQDLDDLIYAVKSGNQDIEEFDFSVFTGEYITKVKQEYFDELEKRRSSS